MSDRRHLSRFSEAEGSRQLDVQTGLERIGMREVMLAPGAATSVRDANLTGEVFIFLHSGEGVLLGPDASSRCAAGDFIGLEDDGQAWRLENVGSSPLRCLIGCR